MGREAGFREEQECSVQTPAEYDAAADECIMADEFQDQRMIFLQFKDFCKRGRRHFCFSKRRGAEGEKKDEGHYLMLSAQGNGRGLGIMVDSEEKASSFTKTTRDSSLFGHRVESKPKPGVHGHGIQTS